MHIYCTRTCIVVLQHWLVGFQKLGRASGPTTSQSCMLCAMHEVQTLYVASSNASHHSRITCTGITKQNLQRQNTRRSSFRNSVARESAGPTTSQFNPARLCAYSMQHAYKTVDKRVVNAQKKRYHTRTGTAEPTYYAPIQTHECHYRRCCRSGTCRLKLISGSY